MLDVDLADIVLGRDNSRADGPAIAVARAKEEDLVMGIQKYIALAFAATALWACGPMSSGTVKDLNIHDWVGHSSNHLIESWGKPHHDYPTPDGGRAIGYMFVNQAVTGPLSQVTYLATTCMINFTVDRNGTIDDATMTGSTCRVGPHGERHPPANRT
jgi:hypothetical protein